MRVNEVGSWTLSIPPEETPEGWPAPGAGVIFLRDGEVVASGMLDERSFAWSADPGDEAEGPGLYSLAGDTDLGRLGYRIVYPTPSVAWADQPNDSATNPRAGYFVYGPDEAEEVLRVTVNWQAGSLALATRRVAGLRLGTSTGAGTQVTIRERFTPLLDALRTVALAGGGLVFDVRDNLNGAMEFVVRAPADKSRTARFGVELGNVRTLSVSSVSATATAALVAGQGDLAARELVEFYVAGERREVFVDQRQVDSTETADARYAEYLKAASEVLAASGEQTAVSALIQDTPTVRWRRDFDLGDKVAVTTPFGAVEDLVRQVDVKIDETGLEEVTSVIGTTQAQTDDPLASTVAALQRRISYLERAL
nr:siphovirus ReqiPepy6 Gp37-like family protein [Actinopolymorpha pittospori]